MNEYNTALKINKFYFFKLSEFFVEKYLENLFLSEKIIWVRTYIFHEKLKIHAWNVEFIVYLNVNEDILCVLMFCVWECHYVVREIYLCVYMYRTAAELFISKRKCINMFM